MPSVRVRRNTATVAALVPAERLRNQSTRGRGDSTSENVAARQASGDGRDRERSSKEGVVELAPPVFQDNPDDSADMKPTDSPLKKDLQVTTASTSVEPTMSSPRFPERKGSGSGVQPVSGRRPRSRTIQAIFPASEEVFREAMNSRRRADIDPKALHEEPEPISPISAERNRTSGEGRLSSEERTHRAEVIARARGESITSTSGGAPVAIRLPSRDRSQAITAGGSPTTSADEHDGHRKRGASITLGLVTRMRRSNEQPRTSGEPPRSATQQPVSESGKPTTGSVDSALGTGPARARSRTVGGPLPVTGRGRSDSVGLKSYFGLGSNGVEAKMQSWEESRRDLEKGVDGGGRESAVNRALAPTAEAVEEEHHEDEVVEHLDCIDPQISAVSHLQNFANSVMIPYIPELYSRKPVLDLPDSAGSKGSTAGQKSATPTSGLRLRKQTIASQPPSSSMQTASTTDKSRQKATDDVSSITESSEEEDALDQHVKDVLKKSKREWLKRSLKGVWAFLKTPIGIITGIYGFLVVFWGAALVLFLLGWIPTSSDNTKDIWVERCSQIVNGLFTVTGVGFIPWRVMDMYRIFRIWQLKRLSAKLRKKKGLPPIEDPDDLPDPKLDPDFEPVLSEYQQALLEYQQERFKASQTWYRPHATETHRAFSINWALYICAFTVGNSVFQCMLCGCMWGLNRHERPAWTTGSLIPLSFGCGIASGILIWKGGQRTKKTAQVEKKLRTALGMDSQENLIDGAEKPSQSSPRKTDTRSSVDSYNNGHARTGSSGPSEDRDSQRLLPLANSSAKESGAVDSQPIARGDGSGEEYEMIQKRNPQSRVEDP